MYGVMPSIISSPALLMFVLLNHVAADIMNLKNNSDACCQLFDSK